MKALRWKQIAPVLKFLAVLLQKILLVLFHLFLDELVVVEKAFHDRLPKLGGIVLARFEVHSSFDSSAASPVLIPQNNTSTTLVREVRIKQSQETSTTCVCGKPNLIQPNCLFAISESKVFFLGSGAYIRWMNR